LPFEAAERDGIFAQDAAAINDAPACGGEGGVDVFGSGFGFVHWIALQGSAEGLVEQGFLQCIQSSELLLIDGFEMPCFGSEGVQRFDDCPLSGDWRHSYWKCFHRTVADLLHRWIRTLRSAGDFGS